MAKMKKLTMEQAVNSPSVSTGNIYMMVQVTGETTIDELVCSSGFYFIEDEEEESFPDQKETKEVPPPVKAEENH